MPWATPCAPHTISCPGTRIRWLTWTRTCPTTRSTRCLSSRSRRSGCGASPGAPTTPKKRYDVSAAAAAACVCVCVCVCVCIYVNALLFIASSLYLLRRCQCFLPALFWLKLHLSLQFSLSICSPVHLLAHVYMYVYVYVVGAGQDH
jgi:hypothetical protein